MTNLRKMVVNYLCAITLTISALIIAVSVGVQILSDREKAYNDSLDTFTQIEQIIKENEVELDEIKQEYSDTCLHNAKTISWMIESDMSVLDSIEELIEIAELTQVDEIHIFDKSGTIVTGTHPEYYGFSFDSGEQMMFFKPMLTDKSLMLVQDITPNTAEGKLMQYSAVWSDDGEFIVQIGMEPVNVMKVTEKNELSYIFSLLRANSGITLYAVDPESEEIVGSTILEDNGKKISDIGIESKKLKGNSDKFVASINGVKCYCIAKNIHTNILIRVIPNELLYNSLIADTLLLSLGMFVIAAILVAAVSRYMNKYVIGKIYDVNEKLRLITNGKLDETVDIQSSKEFSELSSHINEMVKTLLDNTGKLSYVLDKTNLHIGVYEYNKNMQEVRFTEYLPKLFHIDAESAVALFADHSRFAEFMDELRSNAVSGEEGVYRVNTSGEYYVRLDEVVRGRDILGIVIDVTDEVIKRRKIEEERDIDLLTGLYNRRGLDSRLAELFKEPEKLDNAALIMADADGLKTINDQYGHEVGDIYLKKIAEVISSFGKNSCITARQGGDEFVVFLYNYPTEKELLDSIDTLKYLQNNSFVNLQSDLRVPLRFSFGYSLIKNGGDYYELLKSADEKMYESKRERKKAMKG